MFVRCRIFNAVLVHVSSVGKSRFVMMDPKMSLRNAKVDRIDLVVFVAISHMGDNFCDLLFAFLQTKPTPPPGKVANLNKKDIFAPTESKFFFLH